ncbi:uncharacterized protein BO88DRAFT_430572 [Aspergillus vadensis CBS 113365]|uniref:Uncharacterized protein n=1 Tax=Aspergillus vadensis (strain CBS 113365 / IMI 142717 / IBT 24658) TaxID=1448311 RepID=A0A319ASR4_ASPVC|nr:hypothetical protein BO88DRAFT_430572 [Aspergillus vadensis CBS 113365]PYH63329.1 hypothetical protein BO88DRAFT_430572 [Aspergillus vadensis CBS 113365]
MVKWLLGVDLLSIPNYCSFYQGTIDEQWKAFGWAGCVFRRVETLRKPTGTGYQVSKLVIVPHALTLANDLGGEWSGRSFGGILESQRSRGPTERGKEGKKGSAHRSSYRPSQVGSPIETPGRSAARAPFWLVLGLQKKSAALTHRRFPHLFFTSSFPVPSPSSLAISSFTLILSQNPKKGPPGQFISL